MSEQKPLVRLRKKPQYEPVHHIKRAKVEDCINTFAHSENLLTTQIKNMKFMR